MENQVQETEIEDGEEGTMELIILSPEEFSQVQIVQIHDEDAYIFTQQQPIQDSNGILRENEIQIENSIDNMEFNLDGEHHMNPQILEIAMNSIINCSGGEIELADSPATNEISESDSRGTSGQMVVFQSGQNIYVVSDDERVDISSIHDSSYNSINTEAYTNEMETDIGEEEENNSESVELVEVIIQDEENDDKDESKNQAVQEAIKLKSHQVNGTGKIGQMESNPLGNLKRGRGKPYKCAACDARFTDKRKLATHMLKHTNKKPHECNVCNVRFCQESAWRRHNTNFHVTDFSGPLCCPLCKRIFKNITFLNRHNLIKHDITRLDNESSTASGSTFVCLKCPKSFSSKETLEIHSLTKHPSISCFYCDKLFTNKILLRQHSKEVHNKERPYACFKCWKRFTNGPEASAHLAGVHNLNMVRAVGQGRQRDDMYSTNFYDKATHVLNVGEFKKITSQTPSTETTEAITPMTTVATPVIKNETPGEDNDLAARLRGMLSTPRLVAKRKKVERDLSLGLGPIPIPYFTPPPKRYPLPKTHILSNKWGVSDEISKGGGNMSPFNCISKPPWTKPVKAKTQVRTKRPMSQNIKCRKTAVAIGAKSHRPTESEKVLFDLKEVAVILERLPEVVLQEYSTPKLRNSFKLSSSNTSSQADSEDPDWETENSISSSSTISRFPDLSFKRPQRRGVKSIYQRDPGSFNQNMKPLSKSAELDAQRDDPLPGFPPFPEDKRSSRSRRESSQKINLPTKLVTDFELYKLKSESGATADEKCNESEDKPINLKSHVWRNSGRMFQPPKLATPEELMQVKAKLEAEGDL